MMSYDAIDVKVDLERAVQSIDNISQREVARLSLIGYTDEEIANHVGMSIKGVGEMRRRARLKIRYELRDYAPCG